ncbi:polysaccharide pyruvyl transferase family protein [Robiginitalea sp. IMCC44478]|uniref:polysaccharide pyruvyl transferase family protein n=1 Tax=Robiginitalea sp. IMCC44478 TaxID=3459122 RepID=UPI0040429FA2
MIVKYIPLEIKAKLILLAYRFGIKKFKYSYGSLTTKNIYIFLAADYGNLGDAAITYAQHKFLKQHFPDYSIHEIPISCTLEGIAAVKKTITPGDIVTTVGGGNMGDLYPMIETFRQLVIQYFPDNLIVSFPQTVDFKENKSGEYALKKAIKLYSNHPRLVLLAREAKTYQFFREHFKKNHSFLVPDIVMTLKPSMESGQRAGVLICLRNDKEKKLNPDQEKSLLDLVEKEFVRHTFRDTHIGGSGLPLIKRTKELFAIWKDFKNSQLIITDRLHGMIFAFITNTPALVFLNNNHKIQSSYEWIKNSGNIHLMKEFDETKILKTLKSLSENKQPSDGEAVNLDPKFSEALKFIKRTA